MMQWIPYGQTLDEFKDHVRTYATVFPHVIIVFGPGGNGLFMLGSSDPISFDPAAIQAVLSKPGVVQDLSSAADSPVRDQAGWAAEIQSLIWIQGDQVAEVRRVGAARHRRPPAARVLPAPPPVRAAVARDDRAPPPVADPRAMTTKFGSLTIVLPAYNEAGTPGLGPRRAVRLPPPARRAGARGVDRGRRPAAPRSRSSSSTTAAPTARLPSSGPGPSSRHPGTACSWTCSRSPTAARAPRSGPGCSPPRPTSSSSPTRTWPRRPTSCRSWSPASRTTTWSWAAGSSPTAATCAARSRAIAGSLGKVFHAGRLDLGRRDRSRTPSAASRASPGPLPRTCSRASGSPASSSTSS